MVASSDTNEKARREALVENICDSLLSQLISETSQLFSKSKKVETTFKSDVDKNREQKTDSTSQPQISRIEKSSDRATVLPRPGSRSVQDMMLTTFDLGSDTSEGNNWTLCFTLGREPYIELYFDSFLIFVRLSWLNRRDLITQVTLGISGFYREHLLAL